jgi:hypothetical protein
MHTLAYQGHLYFCVKDVHQRILKKCVFSIQVTKQYEAANKDKEVMVMRYAVSEKEVIDKKRERESLEKKLREMSRDRDLLLSKLKNISSEKTSVCKMLDNKVTSTSN